MSSGQVGRQLTMILIEDVIYGSERVINDFQEINVSAVAQKTM